MKKTTTKPKAKKPVRKVNLALQGGGSHGAYTWGVLDRILEEEDIEIAGISGTSAGAMNGAVLIDGLIKGGRAKAKEQLRAFWGDVSQHNNLFGPMQPAVPEWGMAAAYGMLDMFSRTFSPYEFNPMNINPLRDVLERSIDIKNFRKSHKVPLFATATNVQTGQPRVFGCDEITIDVLMASACLPFLFQAVEIEDMAYWDGGYAGNPSIWPLIYHTKCDDILLVQINPIERAGTPKKASEIIDRLNEISFNSSLIAEMRAINFVKKLIERGKLDDEEYKNIRMHMIFSPDAMHGMTASSKLNTNWDFIATLHEIGYKLADEWIRKHKNLIGRESSLNIEKVFLTKPTKKSEVIKRAKSAQKA